MGADFNKIQQQKSNEKWYQTGQKITQHTHKLGEMSTVNCGKKPKDESAAKLSKESAFHVPRNPRYVPFNFHKLIHWRILKHI